MNNKNVGDACMTTALERPGTAAAPGRCHPMSPLTAAILAVLYPGALTLAQTSRAESLQLEEIVVTATRRDLNLQSVPQSVTAFSTADIDKLAMQGAADVISALPSVNLVAAMPGRNAPEQCMPHHLTGGVRATSVDLSCCDQHPQVLAKALTAWAPPIHVTRIQEREGARASRRAIPDSVDRDVQHGTVVHPSRATQDRKQFVCGPA